jgi:hypothetical protein
MACFKLRLPFRLLPMLMHVEFVPRCGRVTG